MSIRSDVLARLAQLTPGGAPLAQVTLADDGAGGSVEALELTVESIGCGFDQLVYRSARLAQVAADELKRLGEDLARRLTYLLEPIRPLELDREGFTLQLRSSPPQVGDDGSEYYEAVARRGGDISLVRYRKLKGQPRLRIAALVTREVLARLCEDLASAQP